MAQPSSTPVIDRPNTDTSLDDQFAAITGFKEELDDGSNKDRFSHYVAKKEIIDSALGGALCTALCGKKWVPSRNPQSYPVCKTCQEIYEGMNPGDDES